MIIWYDHEITYGHSPTCTDSRKVVVSYWQKYVHKYWLTALEDYVCLWNV